MRLRRAFILIVSVHAAGVAATSQVTADATATPASRTVIRSETRLVLVDTIVTDKKANYVRDLTAKDFRVWEDDKEQEITSFSFETDTATSDKSRPRYIVLFFDNSTVKAQDQISVRQAAAKFIEANAGPNRLMAVINYGGTVRIAQNFTEDPVRLKKVVAGVQFPSLAMTGGEPVQVASVGMPSLGMAEADWGARSMLLALRSVARSLATVPGRKTLVLLTSGFVLAPANYSELTAAIAACNRANVAVYPIDARGLMAGFGDRGSLHLPEEYRFIKAAFRSDQQLLAQARGGGGQGGSPGGGGRPGGGSPGPGAPGGGSRPGPSPAPSPTPGRGTPGGSTGGNTGGAKTAPNTPAGGGRQANPAYSPYQYSSRQIYEQPRILIPQFPSASANQQVLQSLAAGTGGFVIANTNDMLGGLEKIGREQSEYYILGYTPQHGEEGKCYTLRVKVKRGGTNVRARSGYCNARPLDALRGKPIEKRLETYATSAAADNLGASILTPYFFTSDNTARVHAAMVIPPEVVKFEKVKGKFHSEINVLGVAYLPDGGIAARFSDNLKFDVESKKEVEALSRDPLPYENQFEIASGQYTLKVMFTGGGDKVGKVEAPLVIDKWERTKFALSTVALSRHVAQITDMDMGLDAELIEGRTLLTALGVRVTPTGNQRFKKKDPAAMYLEIYDPLLASAKPPQVGIQLKLLDRNTGETKQDSGLVNVAPLVREGNPVVPVVMRLLTSDIPPGNYRAEISAQDTAGNRAVRTTDFNLE